MAVTAVRLRVEGLVHGVLFRASMARLASEAGVSGWVRNEFDGTVEAHLEGDERDVRRVLDWAKRGPPRARVDRVDVEKVAFRNLKGFRITG